MFLEKLFTPDLVLRQKEINSYQWTLKVQECIRPRCDAGCVVHGYQYFAGILCNRDEFSIGHILEPEWRMED